MQTHPIRIAALMTCYNRKLKTLATLTSLYHQHLPSGVELSVYLVDDNSTDGTSAAVNESYPQVKIIHGDGNLFWNQGMRKAFAEAMQHHYNFYLWLNDDTQLYPEALKTLLSTYQNLAEKKGEKIIIVGSTQDAETQVLTYGGVVRSSWWHPLKFSKVQPSDVALPCDTMNGNCVLIPQEVVNRVGNLDPAFTHTAGDFDYGLRGQKQGCQVWVAPGYIGTCSRNLPQGNCWQDEEMNLSQRWQKVLQPKGLPPQELKVLAQRNAGLLWPIYWGLPYIRLVLISLFGKLRKNQASRV